MSFVARDEAVLSHDYLPHPPLRMLADVGDIAEHVLVRDVRKQHVAKIGKLLLPRDALAEGDQREVETVDRVVDKAAPRIEVEGVSVVG